MLKILALMASVTTIGYAASSEDLMRKAEESFFRSQEKEYSEHRPLTVIGYGGPNHVAGK